MPEVGYVADRDASLDTVLNSPPNGLPVTIFMQKIADQSRVGSQNTITKDKRTNTIYERSLPTISAH